MQFKVRKMVEEQRKKGKRTWVNGGVGEKGTGREQIKS